jgi:hypothetical protein
VTPPAGFPTAGTGVSALVQLLQGAACGDAELAVMDLSKPVTDDIILPLSSAAGAEGTADLVSSTQLPKLGWVA